MKEEDCKLCQYYTQRRCTHADFSIAGLMGARPRPPAPHPAHPAHPPPLPPDLWMTDDALLLSAYFFKLGYYQPAGPLITTTPLHGGFKDGAGPPSLPPEQPSQFGRYSYQQAPPVVHYGGGFAGQYGSHAHYGSGEVCYGGGRAPGSGPAPPAPSCYRPPPAHRSSTSYRPAPLPPGPHDSQISPTAPEAYAPQYCPPCYRHPHAAPQAPVAYIDPSYQGSCPCPLQSCPKNVHTGPATGNPPAGGGPNTNSPPGGSRAPAPILAPPASSFCVDDKRRAKTSNAKDPPLLNRVLKSECSAKIADLGGGARRASPKREYFPEQATGRSRREAGEGRGGCCPVAVNPSLSVIPPEAHGPPSPARGSAGACIPQPPDPPHPRSPAPAQRRARVGKAAARKSIGADDDPGQTTMLLMCQPQTVPADVAPPERPPRTAAGPVAVPPDDAKSEADSGDEVILLDSPSSKMAPIDLSSSDENGADGRSDADCAIVPAEDADDVIDLSVDAKKESSPDALAPSGRGGPIAPDEGAPGKRDADGGDSGEGRLADAEPKADPKRRRSRPKPEVGPDATDGVPAANGIGEHVKLQKRRKVLADDRGGSYKDLIKKPDKIFKLNNGKRQLNTIKSERSAPDPSDSDGPHRRKAAGKRKSASPAAEPPSVPKRKKLASSLLKYTDRKQSARHYDDPSAEPADDASPSLPKNKSAILLENLIMKNNNIDPTSESVDKTSAAEAEASGGGDAGAVAECVPGFLVRKGKRGGDVGGDAKGRTVLNINNNVVKKMNEADCAQTTLARDKAEGRASVERIARNESESPGPPVRKSDKTVQKDVPAKAKCPADAKDASSKISKADCPKAKKVAKNKIGAALKSVKKKGKPADGGESETVELLPIRRLSNPRWSNGWTWEGEPQQGKVYINNEDIPLIAWCYSGMKHDRAGDSVKRGDCVLLRAGARRTEAPFVARVTQLWENPTDGEMMVSLLWYYRPEHTDCGRQPDDCAEEVFASRHRDANSVACIEDKCYVLTFNEYCRYRKQVKATEENIVCPPSIVPSMPASEMTPAVVTNDGKVPFNISPDLVLFCRRIYDFRLKKIVKPPN